MLLFHCLGKFSSHSSFSTSFFSSSSSFILFLPKCKQAKKKLHTCFNWCVATSSVERFERDSDFYGEKQHDMEFIKRTHECRIGVVRFHHNRFGSQKWEKSWFICTLLEIPIRNALFLSLSYHWFFFRGFFWKQLYQFDDIIRYLEKLP